MRSGYSLVYHTCRSGIGRQRVGDRPEDRLIDGRAHLDEHVAARREPPDGVIEPVQRRRQRTQECHDRFLSVSGDR